MVRGAYLWLAVLLAGAGACSVSGAGHERPTLESEWRSYAREVRAQLPSLTERQRAAVQPWLAAHEQAIRDCDDTLERGQAREAVQGPLQLVGGFLLMDNASGFGLADDIALPFVVAALAATSLVTSSPASHAEQQRMVDAVHASGMTLAEVVARTLQSSQASVAAPGTRQHCIDMYVDCQLNGRRGYSRRSCQPCMDWCLGGGNIWPDKQACDFKER